MNFFREKPKKDEPKQTGFGFSFGNSRNTVEKPSLGLPSFGTSKNNILGGLSSVGSKVGTDLQKVGSGVQQTGKKALDIFFGSGRGKSESSSSGLSLGAETHSKAGFPNLSLGGSSLPHPSGNIGGPLGSVNFNSTSLDVNLKGPKDNGIGFPKIPSVEGLGKGKHVLSSPGISFGGSQGLPGLSIGGPSLPHPSGSLEGPLGNVNFNSTSLDVNLKGPKDFGIGFPKIPSVEGLGKGAETHGKAGFPNLSLGGASLPHPSGSIEGPLGSVNLNSTSLDINLKGPKDIGVGFPKIPSVGGLGKGAETHGKAGFPNLSLGGASLPHPSGSIEGPLGSVNFNITSMNVNLKGPKDDVTSNETLNTGKHGLAKIEGSADGNTTSLNIDSKGPQDGGTTFLPNTAIELKSVSIGAKTGKKHHVTPTVGGLIEGTQGKPGKHLLDISTNNSHNNKNLTLPQVSNQIGGLGSGVNIISVPTKEQLPGTISLDNQINRGIGVPDLSLGQQGILKPSGNIEGESVTIQSNLGGTTDNSRGGAQAVTTSESQEEASVFTSFELESSTANSTPSESIATQTALKKIEEILHGKPTNGTSSEGRNNGSRETAPGGIAEVDQSEKDSDSDEFRFVYREEFHNISHEKATTPTGNFDAILEEKVHEASTTERANRNRSRTLPPYFILSKNTGGIGEQFIPELPPSALDKPTGEKAPFIPLLPHSSTQPPLIAPIGTPAKPIPQEQPLSMNPIEATTIAVGAIAIITILVFIYKKMKNIVSRASSTGSYSPKDFRKGAKRGSSSSGGSEDGQAVLSQETKDVPENPDNEFTDVTVHRTEDCVETKTTYLLSKSNLRATSSKVVEDSVIPTKEKYQEKTDDTFEKPLDFVEVISEKQIMESNDPPEAKPSRKGKAPVTPPDKFTSDKSAASSLNQDSLRSVSHAISGILKDQMPEIVVAEKIEGGRVGDSEYGIIGAETTSASQSRNLPTGEGYITPISDTQELPTDQGDINYEQDGSKTVRPYEKQTDSLHIGESNTSTREEASDLLQTSLKTEHDGSEYFSADEISESSQESFSPRTLIPDISDSSTDSTGDSACGRKRTLRASDLYNVDDATEYGRQESTDEDFLDTSDSLGENKESESSTDTAVFRDLEAYQVEPELVRGESERAEILHDGKLTSSTPQQAETEVHKRNRLNAAYDDYLEEFPSHLPRNVHLQNLINSENDSSRVYEGDDAESVVSEIMKTSNLDSTTTQSIRIDLGPTEPSLSASADALESATSKQDALIKQQIGENSGGSELHLKESINLTGRDLDGCIISKEERESLQFDLDHQKEHFETFDTGRNLQDFIVPKKEIGITQIDQQYSGELTKEKVVHFANDPLQIDLTQLEKNPEIHKDSRELEYDNQNINIASEDVSTTQTVQENNNIQTSELVSEKTTKWYVPDQDQYNLETGHSEGLFISLDEKQELFRFDEAEKYHTGHPQISSVYLNINEGIDGADEVWPNHLPRNIHVRNISGAGIIKAAESSDNDHLIKEKYTITSTEVWPNHLRKNIHVEDQSSSSNSETIQSKTAETSNLPQFKIPNMDQRLQKKRNLKRRQIKSLDSGVYQYYGEYMDLVEFPELESKQENGRRVNGNGKIISIPSDIREVDFEEIIIVQPDGTLEEKKIIID